MTAHRSPRFIALHLLFDVIICFRALVCGLFCFRLRCRCLVCCCTSFCICTDTWGWIDGFRSLGIFVVVFDLMIDISVRVILIAISVRRVS